MRDGSRALVAWSPLLPHSSVLLLPNRAHELYDGGGCGFDLCSVRPRSCRLMHAACITRVCACRRSAARFVAVHIVLCMHLALHVCVLAAGRSALTEVS
jgi:hypothetical protein